jgi:hypothetical protein
MASGDSVPESTTPVLRQNWVLGPISDFLLIIAAPVLGLFWAVATYHIAYRISIDVYHHPAEVAIRNGVTAVLSIFMVFNVAHHLPTFIRIYGDRDLVRRFRWSLLLGPVVPLAASIALASYVIAKDIDIGFILYINLILILWDPWHFLMQHYGFMRIYDRHNAAPRKLAGWMDYGICTSWFVFIMIATADWLPDILYRIQLGHGLPVLDWLPVQGLHVMELIALVVAIAMSVVYLGYLNWCRGKGYYVSFAKVWLVLTTFAVMYLTYVPNPWIRSLVPHWTFSMGFAALGMVHVSQYLAIVWKYNRSLAKRNAADQPGLFERIFGHQGKLAMLVLAGYVAACLIYGFILSSTGSRIIVPLVGANTPFVELGMILKWFVVALGALVFTSTLLHYYYDGFIWKVRHKENRQNLAMLDSTEQPSAEQTAEHASWWDRRGPVTVATTLGWHCLYFLVPIGILTATFFLAGFDRLSPLHEYESRLQNNQLNNEWVTLLLLEIEDRLSVEEKLMQIRPRASYYGYSAELYYLRAKLRTHQMEKNPATGYGAALLVKEDLLEAKKTLETMLHELKLPPPYAHREKPNWTRQDAELLLQAVRRELAELTSFLADNS